jgi:hypothetical protein
MTVPTEARIREIVGEELRPRGLSLPQHAPILRRQPHSAAWSGCNAIATPVTVGS